MRRRIGLLALCVACKGETVTSGPTGIYPVGDAEWVVHADGRAVLRVNGRDTLALASGPLARTFDETVEGALGMWTFTRDGVQERAHDTRISVSQDGDAVVLVYDGATVTARPDGPDRTRITAAVDGPADAVAIPVRCDDDGSFHGWGEQYALTDQRGEAFTLLVSEQGIGREGSVPFFSGDAHTTYFPMPYYLDGRGFGVLVETDQRVEVDLCATDPERAVLEVVDDAPVELVVFHGPRPLDVVRQLGDLVGRPTAPPAWAFGTWICTQGGEASVLAQADLLEAQDIPAAVLWVQDWTGAAVNLGGGYGVNYRWVPDDGALYPDLPGLVGTLHDRGLKVVGYVNPFVDPGLPNHYDEMAAAGMLPQDPVTGAPYLFFGPRGEMTTADLTSEAARSYIRAHLRAAVTDVGLDGWMADFAEWLPLDARLSDGSDPVAAHNRYPEHWQRLTREVMEELRPDGDWLMFARSGWTGVHAVAQVHWVGDQEADFSIHDGLPTVVPAMLTLGLSGQPHVTHDIAGFSGGPSSEELYRRWTELGAFTPYMRTHDGNARADNWRWDRDEATLAHFRRFARIHEALRPELEALAAEASSTGAPIVRHLMLDDPEDRETWAVHDQYLLGSDLLVAPVLTEGATRRALYLPEGDWFHVWTGARHEGPAWVEVEAPIGAPPVFARGSDRADLREIQ